MKKLLLILGGLSVCMVFSVTSYAVTETTNLDVGVSVPASCTAIATGIIFPDFHNTPDDFANGDVTVNCSTGTPYNIALDAGLNYSGLYRRVSDGTNFIVYRLFKDGGWINDWGDSDYANTYLYGSSLADAGNGSNQPHTVYGIIIYNIPYDPAPPPGVYTDTVAVTVHY